MLTFGLHKTGELSGELASKLENFIDHRYTKSLG